ncbi:MAG: hypothetical protein COB93_10695 [Sneathiella sp.]|nr:MAG: hypothetical protein COB93_10695 [Sneathiella sp.]
MLNFRRGQEKGYEEEGGANYGCGNPGADADHQPSDKTPWPAVLLSCETVQVTDGLPNFRVLFGKGLFRFDQGCLLNALNKFFERRISVYLEIFLRAVIRRNIFLIVAQLFGNFVISIAAGLQLIGKFPFLRFIIEIGKLPGDVRIILYKAIVNSCHPDIAPPRSQADLRRRSAFLLRRFLQRLVDFCSRRPALNPLHRDMRHAFKKIPPAEFL